MSTLEKARNSVASKAGARRSAVTLPKDPAEDVEFEGPGKELRWCPTCVAVSAGICRDAKVAVSDGDLPTAAVEDLVREGAHAAVEGAVP